MATPKVLELDDIIRRHAWELLNKRSNFLRRWLLEEDDYRCEVDWKSITLDHNVSKFDIRPDNRTFQTDWGCIKTGMRWTPLLTCEFDNSTETKQSHTFHACRETTTWISVDLHQGYTINKEVDVDVTCPTRFDHFRAGRDTGFKVTKVKGNVFKEVLSWDVNSQVEVLPSWKAHAQLLARQESHVIDFEVRTTLILPSGVLPVYFHRIGSKSTIEVRVYDFEKAFQSEEVEGGLLKEEQLGLVNRITETVIDQKGNGQSSSKVQLITRGSCVCVAWSDQKVDIDTELLILDKVDVDKTSSHADSGAADVTQHPASPPGLEGQADTDEHREDDETERLIANGKAAGDVQMEEVRFPHGTPSLADLIKPPSTGHEDHDEDSAEVIAE